MKTIPATEVSKEFERFLDTVQKEPVLVTKKNPPVAVTMATQDTEAFLQMQTEVGVTKSSVETCAGRFSEFTPKYARDLVARFKTLLK